LNPWAAQLAPEQRSPQPRGGGGAARCLRLPRPRGCWRPGQWPRTPL